MRFTTTNTVRRDTRFTHRETRFEALEPRRLLSAAAGPSISVADLLVTEGHSGTRSALLTVRLSAASNKTISVNYHTEDGIADAGADYQAVSGKLTFAAGETLKTIPVSVFGDRLGEPDESFTLKLSGAKNGKVRDGQAVVTIVDDEPRVTVDDAAQLEGGAGGANFAFTVSLSAASDVPVTVHYATADGTATTADGDYDATSGTLIFAPGETTKSVAVTALGDAASEPDETFFLNLSSAINAFLVDPQSTGRIVTDDPWTVEPDPQEPCMVDCGVDGDGGWSGVAP